MSFKSRKISQKSKKELPKKTEENESDNGAKKNLKKKRVRIISYVIAGILLLIGLFIVIRVSFSAYRIVADPSIDTIVEEVGIDLDQDENGFTNILLLGDGGFVREGAGLVDTIMVASIDHESNVVSLLSVPRDYYITRTNNLGLNRYGKINEIYVNYADLDDDDEQYNMFKKAVGELFDMDIQYYMRIDFKGFVEVVDSIEGITVDVPATINDTLFPNATDTGYDPFYIEAGVQVLDGETALKYARSRHGTGDFDRSFRQQLILKAIQDKILTKETLTSLETITDLYNSVNENMNTDLKLRELVTLAGVASGSPQIVSGQLHDDPGQTGGFLYNPPAEIFGTYALLPYDDDIKQVQGYANLIFNHRDIYTQQPHIQILNATSLSGIAGSLAYELNRHGLMIEDEMGFYNVGNHLDEFGEKQLLDETVIYFNDWAEDEQGVKIPVHQSTLEVLNDYFVQAEFIPSERQIYLSSEDDSTAQNKSEDTWSDIVIVLGADYGNVLEE